jgi:NADPH:quinone reductase-like Zn-dependent oxidoreductase
MKTASIKTMQAMLLEKNGAPLALRTLPIPTPGKGQVLVKVAYSGVNPLDLKIKEGTAAHAGVKLPFVTGIDMSGIVVATGEGVTKFRLNDEVYGMVGGVGAHQGTLAEYIAVDADLLALKPSNISFKEAAAIPLVFITAWEGLVDRAKVHAGQKVLVHGGAGGVGHMAVQIARAFGAMVYATETGKGLDYLTGIGATAIDFTVTQPETYVKDYTHSEGFDIVFDTVGGATLDNSFKSVKNYTGHVVSSLGWGTHSLAPLSFKGATYSGIFTLLPLLSGKGKAHHGEILYQATQLMEAGKLKPLLHAEDFTLNQANEAYQALEKRTANGKVVISISE